MGIYFKYIARRRRSIVAFSSATRQGQAAASGRGCLYDAGAFAPASEIYFHFIADWWVQKSLNMAFAASNGMQVVIPPKKNRKQQRDYDKSLYKLRHLVENAFLKLKRWRGIATRYAKTTSSFIGAVTLACIMLWLSVLV